MLFSSLFHRLSLVSIFFIYAYQAFSLEIPNLSDLDQVLPSCLGGITAFTGCKKLSSSFQSCNKKSSSNEKLDCYCTQSFFNSIQDCRNEARLCTQSDLTDPEFDTTVKQWHAECDSRVSFKPTTAPVATLTAPLDVELCSSLYRDCETAVFKKTQCSQSATASTAFVSCMCQSEMTTLMSKCYYDADVSCLALPATKENIPGYNVCPAFQPGKTAGQAELSSALEIWPFTLATGVTRAMPNIPTQPPAEPFPSFSGFTVKTPKMAATPTLPTATSTGKLSGSPAESNTRSESDESESSSGGTALSGFKTAIGGAVFMGIVNVLLATL